MSIDDTPFGDFIGYSGKYIAPPSYTPEELERRRRLHPDVGWCWGRPDFVYRVVERDKGTEPKKGE